MTIPCSIGNSIFEKALCDLHASINLMSSSTFKKLSLGEANPTTITLQLAIDLSLTPWGIIEVIVSNRVGHTDPLETSLTHGDSSKSDDEEVKGFLMWMDSFGPIKRKYFKSLGASPSHPTPSIRRSPILKEKTLPAHLRFSYLGASSTFPIIISSCLSRSEDEKLLRVLREHKGAIAWSIVNSNGIRPSMCMHRILL